MSQTKAQILQGKGTANTVEGLTASGIVTASAFDVGTTIQIGNAGVITATSLDVRTLSGDINVGGAVTITGNLRVDGTQTIVNTETLDVADKTVGIGSTTNPSNTTADGAGIEVYGGADGNKSLLWSQTGEKWTLSGGALSVGSSITGGNIHGTDLDVTNVNASDRVLIGTTDEGHASADDLTIATSGHTGMTIRSGTSNSGSIYFSSATSGGNEYNGYIIYNQTDDSLRFGTNENDRIRISGIGSVGISTAAPRGTFDIGDGNEVSSQVDLAAVDIDCSKGNFFRKQVAGSVTFTISNVPTTSVYSFTLLIDYSSGSIAWPGTFLWPDGSAPTLSSGKKHLIMGVTNPNTSNFRMSYLPNYAS